MVKIRLKRTGKTNAPHYRLVIIKQRTKRDGASIEDVGHYAPFSKELVLNKERIEYWLKVGAKPTETVERMLIKEGLIAKPKYQKKFDTKPGKKSQERAEQKKAKAQTAKEEVSAETKEKTEETKSEENQEQINEVAENPTNTTEITK